MNVIRWITDRIFGFDVFISYSRKDGVAYARKLEEELLQRRLRCFLDSKEMPPGSELKASLLSAVARSTTLVLVAVDDTALLDLIFPVEKKFQHAAIQMLSQKVTSMLINPEPAEVSGLNAKLRKFRGLKAMNPALTRQTESLQDRMDKSFPVKVGTLPQEGTQTGEE